MILRRAIFIFAAAFTSLTASAAKDDEQMVKNREASMTLIGKYFGPLYGMSVGKVPFDAKIVQRNAEHLAALEAMAWDDFDPSSKGAKSQSLPITFSEPAKFKEQAEKFKAEVAKLVVVSKGKDDAATKAQIGAVGKSCGSCHEMFREKKK